MAVVATAADGFSGVGAAVGLVLFFVCALYPHVQAGDCTTQFYLAAGFPALNVTVLALS